MEPESLRLWLMAEVLKLRQLGFGIWRRERAYVGNNLRRSLSPCVWQSDGDIVY